MKTATALITCLTIAASVPAVAAAPLQTEQAAAKPAAPQMTDKEKKAMDHCKKLPHYQLEQNSKCTKLMKKFGVDSSAGHQDMMRENSLRR